MENNTIDNNLSEKWLELIICLNLILSEDERLWDKYQNRKSKKRTTYLKQILGKYETEIILEPGVILYRARAINSKNNNEARIHQELNAICLELEKYFATKMGQGNFNKNNDILSLILLNNESEDEKYKSIMSRLSEINKIQFQGFHMKQCSCPPKSFIKEGRLNCKDDEYLYLSSEINTCINEMRPANHHKYSVASCKIKKRLKLYDVTYNSLLKNSNHLIVTNSVFIANKISEPNSLEDRKFYSITQEFAHIVEDKGYDGIKYDSAMCKNGTNYLLFDTSAVEFKDSKIIEINNINVKFKNILDESSEN